MSSKGIGADRPGSAIINGKSTVKFQKGNKQAKGGKREGAGRPTNEAQAEKKGAAILARERMEARVDAVMDEYLRIAEGGRVKKGSSPATIRHFVERLIAPARSALDVAVGTPEEFYRAIQQARRARSEKLSSSYDQKKTHP